MKLIIDIPDKAYGLLKYFEDAMGLADEKEDNVKTALIRAVINGTPLDSVKEEIDKAYDSLPRYYPFALNTFAIIVDEILDNIGKESEEI